MNSRPVNAVLDLTASSRAAGAGVGRYGVSLACALAALRDDVNLSLSIRYGPRGRRKSLRAQMASTGWPGTELPSIARWGWWTSPPKGDVFHAVGTRIPRRKPGKRIATIHDLSALDLPEFLGPRETEQQIRRLARATAKADAIIVPSTFTRDRLRAHFGSVPAERVHVIPHGNSLVTSDDEAVRAFRTRHGLRQQYVLHVGLHLRRKNLSFLFQAFAAAKHMRDFDLVLVGATTAHTRDLLELADRLRISERVRILGRLSDTALAAAYRGAAICVNPSLYEGFGLSLLEGLASGTPCVASAEGAHADVHGGTAIIPDGFSVSRWASALDELATDLDAWEPKREAAQAHAATFTWAATAKVTTALYRQLAGLD